MRGHALAKLVKCNSITNAQFDKRISKVFLTYMQVTRSLTNFCLRFMMNGHTIQVKKKAPSW